MTGAGGLHPFLPSFLTLIDRACRVMSGNKSFAAFGRHLRRPPRTPSAWAVRTRSTLFPRRVDRHHSAAHNTFFTLVHSFIPPLGVVPPSVRPYVASSLRPPDRHLRNPLLSLGVPPDHRRPIHQPTTMGSFLLSSSFLPARLSSESADNGRRSLLARPDLGSD